MPHHSRSDSPAVSSGMDRTTFPLVSPVRPMMMFTSCSIRRASCRSRLLLCQVSMPSMLHTFRKPLIKGLMYLIFIYLFPTFFYGCVNLNWSRCGLYNDGTGIKAYVEHVQSFASENTGRSQTYVHTGLAVVDIGNSFAMILAHIEGLLLDNSLRRGRPEL